MTVTDSVAFTETATLGCWRLSLLQSPVLAWPCSSLCWNLFLPLFMLIHSSKSKWEWARSLVTSCMGVKLCYPSPTHPNTHTCTQAGACISVGHPRWVRVQAHSRSIPGLDGQISQSVPAKLPALQLCVTSTQPLEIYSYMLWGKASNTRT